MPTVAETTDRSDPGDSRTRRRDLLILAIGASLGIAIALYGLLVPETPRTLPDDAAARVNGRLIDNADLADALAALGSDSRDRLDEADRDWILQRLIEEELLVQRALALDLGHEDRAVRAALVDAMLRRVTREAVAVAATDDELREWYAGNRELFAGADRLRVELRVLTEGPAGDIAGSAPQAPAPDPAPLPELPDTLLPPAKLRDYLGPGLTAALAEAPVGRWTDPLPYAGRHVIARVTERRSGAAPPFGEIRAQVEAAWRRARMDAALAAYLQQLEKRADIDRAAR